MKPKIGIILSFFILMWNVCDFTKLSPPSPNSVLPGNGLNETSSFSESESESSSPTHKTNGELASNLLESAEFYLKQLNANIQEAKTSIKGKIIKNLNEKSFHLKNGKKENNAERMIENPNFEAKFEKEKINIKNKLSNLLEGFKKQYKNLKENIKNYGSLQLTEYDDKNILERGINLLLIIEEYIESKEYSHLIFLKKFREQIKRALKQFKDSVETINILNNFKHKERIFNANNIYDRGYLKKEQDNLTIMLRDQRKNKEELRNSVGHIEGIIVRARQTVNGVMRGIVAEKVNIANKMNVKTKIPVPIFENSTQKLTRFPIFGSHGLLI
ncbi:unnamed protein product [Meloidogyne enterolobii]|uniref:Uncharacterized protein n=1 Tax=Meloidogyne enterolobii TaxID=390850 RepID=A0ACB1ATJ6_MELEN